MQIELIRVYAFRTHEQVSRGQLFPNGAVKEHRRRVYAACCSEDAFCVCVPKIRSLTVVNGCALHRVRHHFGTIALKLTGVYGLKSEIVPIL